MTGQKILVRTPQWLGDAVVSTTFLTQLKKKSPPCQLTVLTPTSLAEIFETHPSVDAVISIPKDEQNVFSVARSLKKETFDVAYVLPRSFRTALEATLGKIPKRIGFAGDFRRFLLTEIISYESRLSYPHRYLKLIGEDEFPLEQLSPHFPQLDEKKMPIEEIIEGLFRGISKPILGLAPVSIAPSRTWPMSRFAEVANRFQKEFGGTILIFGSEREKPMTTALQKMILGPSVETAGQLKWAELGSAVQSCDAMVVNDSGLMHVASCFKVPTVVVFGASDPQWALPRWGKFIPLQKKEIACVPCGRNRCVRFGNYYNECLDQISVDDVFNALRPLVGGLGTNGSI